MTEQLLNTITIILTSLVVIAFIIAFIYIKRSKSDDKLIEKRRWVESLPTLISSLGVLGTFAGITLGLVYFDPSNLDESIPKLLGGLKTAFFTSLAGMVGSLILSRIVSATYDETDKGVSDINVAAGLITQSVANMEKSNTEEMTKATQLMEQLVNNQIAFFNNIESIQDKQSSTMIQMVDDQYRLMGIIKDISDMQRSHFVSVEEKQKEHGESLTSQMNSLTNVATVLGLMSTALASVNKETLSTKDMLEERLTDLFNALENRLESITISVGNVEEVASKQAGYMKSVNDNVSEIVESSAGTYGTQNDIIDEIKKLSPVIRDEVTEIEEKMKETNQLLTVKFDEFSELLKKSNTEALVEVMRGVTLEFEKQMNALISKLIQENFEQLNASVANMIQWQQDNKEMISALTSQYKQMNTSFEQTSTTLQKVESDTKLLVSDGSKLHAIINGLELVLAKDKDFVATAKSLRKAAEDNEKNVAEYQKYTKELTEWVEKQRNFSDSVKDLIKKLEELDKLRDYNNEFWADAKRNLMEAQDRLHDSANFLQGEIETLDQHFYNRLSETLSQLDVCIQAMVNNNR